LTLLPPPLPLARIEQAVQWHKYRTHDPGLVWLRGLLHEAVLQMDAECTPVRLQTGGSARHRVESAAP
ncbi:MAG: hypothetical protein ABJA77_13560, partial [Variovorax sp.]